MTDPVALDAAIDSFEHAADREFHIGLARNCLASVPDDYTDDQLDDIGRRARHWAMRALREYIGARDDNPTDTD